MSQTPRLSLPYILVNQAQKEMTHNEALNRLDALLHLLVSDRLADPPASPAEGAVYLVEAPAGGVWTGQEGALAQWLAGSWIFIAAAEGMRAWIQDEELEARFGGGVWSAGEVRGTAVLVAGVQVVGAQQPAIAGASGGATVDAEARTAVDAILAALRSHGLVAS